MPVFSFFLFFFSIQNKNLIIHLRDNFHIVNVCTDPTEKASFAIHMVSSLLDIQPVSAVRRPENPTTIQSTTYVKIKGHSVLFRGGIVKELIAEEMTLLLTKLINDLT